MAAEIGSLSTANGSLLVLIEYGAICHACGERIPKGTTAVLAWGGPQSRQPSRLHHEGADWTTLTHETCRQPRTTDKPPSAQLHSPTSVAAATAITAATPTLREAVYKIIHDRHGLTDEEGAELLGMGLNTYRPRRIELVEIGAVIDTGQTRKTRAGRQATVWDVL